jgi:hypothetical protein
MKAPSELYFDISSEKTGGSLFRIMKENAPPVFKYSYSQYDQEKDEIKVFEKLYAEFGDFWNDLIRDKEWHYLHPLFVHPDQREFVRKQLLAVDWSIHPDIKWQLSHQRQWKKVLSDPPDYYQFQQ